MATSSLVNSPRHSRALLLAVGLASALTLAACGGGGGSSVTLATPTTTALTAASSGGLLYVTDASGNPVSTSVALTSTAAGATVNATGSAITSVSTSSGVASFNLASSATLPLTVYAEIAPAGYVPQTVAFTYTASGFQSKNVTLLSIPSAAGSIAGTPAGVTGQVQTGTVAGGGGAVSSTITLTAAGASYTDVSGATQPALGITVTIPAGTVLRTASGTAAANGSLTLVAVTYSPNSTNGLDAFPGGFSAGGTVSGGVLTPASVATSGFSTFLLRDSAGNTLTQFTVNPVTVRMDLPATTRDSAGAALANGSTMKIYSYNETLKGWAFESNGTVGAANGNGTWPLTYTTTHFSTIGSVDTNASSCTASIAVTGLSAVTGAVRGKLTLTSVPSATYEATLSNNAFSFPNVPANKTAILKVTVNGQNATVALGEIANACATSLSSAVTPPAVQTGVVSFTTTESCADGSNTRGVPAAVLVIQGSGGALGGTTSAAGTLSLTVNSGAAVAWGTNPRSGLAYPLNITVPTGNGTVAAPYAFQMPCGNVTGTGGGNFGLP